MLRDSTAGVAERQPSCQTQRPRWTVAAGIALVSAGVTVSCRRSPPPSARVLEGASVASMAPTAPSFPPASPKRAVKGRTYDVIPQPDSELQRGTQPVLTFFSTHITKGSRFDVKDLDVIVAHASFIAPGGARIAVRADETRVQQHPEQGHYFILTPMRPLAVDTRYDLEIIEDETVRVLAPPRFHGTRDGVTSYRQRLATGPRRSAAAHAEMSSAAQATMGKE